MFRSTLSIAAFALAITLPGTRAAAQSTSTDSTHKTARTHAKHEKHEKGEKSEKAESQADLQASAKISMDSARTIAMAKVPGATVKSSELERYRGTVAYSFDLDQSGKAGAEEVIVSAKTGKVLKKYHESAKSEAREEKKEGKATHGDSVSADAHANMGMKAGGMGTSMKMSGSTKAKGKNPPTP